MVDSAFYDYWEGTSKYSQITSFFWSAKKLEVKRIVKDFTTPVYSTCFSRKYDKNGNRDSFFLSFSDDGKKASQKCISGTATLMYKAHTESIGESGDATAHSI